MKKCILCTQKPPINNSHVIPKFAIKRLKAGNPIGTLAYSDNPSKVEQDGWKSDYLCKDCEARFNKLETWFCNTIYDPFIKQSISQFKYDKRLLEFSLSIYFRYIKYLMDRNKQNTNYLVLLKFFEDFGKRLKKNDYSNLYSYLSFHYTVEELTEGYVPGINTYFFECIDGNMFDYHLIKNDDRFWIMFVKLPWLYFVWSEFDLKQICKNKEEIEELRIKQNGTFRSQLSNSILDKLFIDEFNKRALQIQNNYFQMSDKRIEKNIDKIYKAQNLLSFRAHKSFQEDLKLLKKNHIIEK